MSNPAATPFVATAADDVDPSRWESLDDTGGVVRPWLYDPDGNILRLPAHCSGFQVRFWSPGARGGGELVTDEDTGLPLFVARTTGPDEFLAMVQHKGPGRFRLFLLDEEGQKMKRVPAQITVTKKMARPANDAGDGGGMPPPSSSPLGGDLIAQVFAMQADQFKAILAQQAQVMAQQSQQQSHQMDMVCAQVGRMTEAVAGILSSAGSSGLLLRGEMKVAAVGVVPPSGSAPASSATPGPVDPAPRDATPVNANVRTNERNADASKRDAKTEADEGDDEDKKPSGASMMAEMFKPFAEKLAPVAAYSAAKAMNCSEEQALQFAGMANGAVSKGLDVLIGDKPAGTPKSGVAAPISGAALDAQVAAIRARLSSDEETLLIQIGLRHYPRRDELTALVGEMPLDEGVSTIRKVAAIWRDLNEAERSFMHRMVDQSGFGVLTNVAEEDTVEQAVRLVRRAKAADDAQVTAA